jgi:chromosome segregation ATPase
VQHNGTEITLKQLFERVEQLDQALNALTAKVEASIQEQYEAAEARADYQDRIVEIQDRRARQEQQALTDERRKRASLEYDLYDLKRKLDEAERRSSRGW